MPSLLLIRFQTSKQGTIGFSRLDVVRLGKDCKRTELAFEVVVLKVGHVTDVAVEVDDV